MPMPRVRLTVLVPAVAAAILLVPVTPDARQPRADHAVGGPESPPRVSQRAGGQAQAPTFRSTVDLVQVDVVAVDADGNHVTGLTAADFEVFDRGRPQAVATFEEVSHTVMRESPWVPDVPPMVKLDVASNQAERADRLVVLVVDDLHLYRGRTDRAKDLARGVVNNLGGEASMAVLFTSGDHSTEVTADRTRLLEAIDTLKAWKGWRRPHQARDDQKPIRLDPEEPPEIWQQKIDANQQVNVQEFFDNMSQFKTLDDAARILGAGEARRKAFVMISEGIDMEMTGLFDGAIVGGYHAHAVQHMMQSLQRSGVATYAIDPRGYVSPQDLLRENFPEPPGLAARSYTTPDDVDKPTDWDNPVRRAQRGLEVVAEASGGFAVTNTDDFDAGLHRILEDLDHYYLLGFYPADPDKEGWRKLEVKSKRPGLTLRFRNGYDPAGPPDPPKNTTALTRLASGALPATDLPMRLHALPMPYSGKESRVAVAMEISVPRSLLAQPDQRLLDTIEYGVFAVDLKSEKVRERVGRGARIALRPRPGAGPPPENLTYVITAMLPLPPGRYQLRASATSEKFAAGGSVYLSLEVPDFSKADLALTDLVVGYADGPHVPIARDQPRSQIPAANLLPFDPTLDRIFTPRDVLRLYFKAVQKRDRPLTATVQALDADGRVVVTFDREMKADRTSALDVNLPLAQLRPGGYRLHVRVRGGGDTAEREVGFEVRDEAVRR
ncbi:MAG: VWA domain-containing protein [Vicinamibacterales bacterium]